MPLKYTINKKSEYKVVELHDHIFNATKRYIQTFKYHFISDLYATDSNFTVLFCYKTLVQAQYTLNIL